MRKNTKFGYGSIAKCASVAALLSLASCGTLGGNGGNLLGSNENGSQGVLESVLGSLIGNALPINEASVVGTWHYTSPEVRFDSENALAKAGGEVAATQIESKLADYYAKVGIKPGACSFTFGNDKSCTVTVGGRSISGTFSIDPNTHAFNFRSSTGLISLNGKIYNAGTSLALIFDAKKLLSLMQTISAFTGQGSSTLSQLSTLLTQYDGLMLGMNIKK